MKTKMFLIIVFIVLVTVSLMSSCRVQSDQQNELSGILRIDGSTTVYPVAKKAADIFMEKHPKVVIIVDQSSSGEGYQKILEKKVDIVDATRPPHDAEIASASSKGIRLHMSVIGNDGIGIIVHKSNPLNDISTQDLKKIFFTGEITDWSQLTSKGKSGKIKVYGTNPEISGTADLFISKLGDGKNLVSGYQTVYPTPHIVSVIASEPDGIAFVPLKWGEDDSVKLLSLDRIFPTTQSILDGSNPLARKMLMVTDGTPKGLAREFINFILTEEGQNIVREEGFIPVTA